MCMRLKKYLQIGFWSALLGTVAGLFMAKKPGKELYEDIKVKGEEIKEKAGEIAEKVEEKAKETVAEIKETIEEEKK